MRRKVLQDFVNVFCQMAVGWRMSFDIIKLEKLPDGVLVCDALSGDCVHSRIGNVDLSVGKEICAWFEEQLTRHKLSAADISSAGVEVRFAKRVVKSRRKNVLTFDFTCRSWIETDQKRYEAELKKGPQGQCRRKTM